MPRQSRHRSQKSNVSRRSTRRSRRSKRSKKSALKRTTRGLPRRYRSIQLTPEQIKQVYEYEQDRKKNEQDRKEKEQREAEQRAKEAAERMRQIRQERHDYLRNLQAGKVTLDQMKNLKNDNVNEYAQGNRHLGHFIKYSWEAVSLNPDPGLGGPQRMHWIDILHFEKGRVTGAFTNLTRLENET